MKIRIRSSKRQRFGSFPHLRNLPNFERNQAMLPEFHYVVYKHWMVTLEDCLDSICFGKIPNPPDKNYQGWVASQILAIDHCAIKAFQL